MNRPDLYYDVFQPFLKNYGGWIALALVALSMCGPGNRGPEAPEAVTAITAD